MTDFYEKLDEQEKAMGEAMSLTAMEFVKKNEGFKPHPYRCTAGKLTIGFGRNLDDVGISESEAEALLQLDLCRAKDDLIRIFGLGFGRFSRARQIALVDMMFNLGRTRFLGFSRMIREVRDGHWDRAADEAKDSRWYNQVGDRGEAVVRMLREGVVGPWVSNRSGLS